MSILMTLRIRSLSTLSKITPNYNPSVMVDALKKDFIPQERVTLSPLVFGTYPRVDIIHENLKWQATYKVVDWRCITTRADLTYRSQRKPWPQKGLGKARHGNKRTHLWIGGGQCNGPRGPQNYFSVLPLMKRLKGLTSTLTLKHIQGDLKVVDSFNFSEELEEKCKNFFSRLQSDETPFSELDELEIRDKEKETQDLFLETSSKLRSVLDEKEWMESVLFVSNNIPSIDSYSVLAACNSYAHFIETDISERSASKPIPIGSNPSPRALHPGRGLTLMPVESLNVWSMIHHDKIIITQEALVMIQDRLEHNLRLSETARNYTKFSSTIHHPNWMTQKDLLDDTEYEIKRERHFTGRTVDLDEFKRSLS